MLVPIVGRLRHCIRMTGKKVMQVALGCNTEGKNRQHQES